MLCGRDDPQQVGAPNFDEIMREKEEARIQKRAQRYLRDLRNEYKLPDPETGKRRFDELAYSAELRSRLEAAQPVDDNALLTLARQRRDMTVAFLTSLQELDPSSFAAGELLEADTGDSGRVRVPLVIAAAE